VLAILAPITAAMGRVNTEADTMTTTLPTDEEIAREIATPGTEGFYRCRIAENAFAFRVLSELEWDANKIGEAQMVLASMASDVASVSEIRAQARRAGFRIVE
jgi:hypothetical protein